MPWAAAGDPALQAQHPPTGADQPGEYFLARSLPLLEADQLVQSLQPLSVAPAGPLRVSVFESFGAPGWRPVCRTFWPAIPGAARGSSWTTAWWISTPKTWTWRCASDGPWTAACTPAICSPTGLCWSPPRLSGAPWRTRPSADLAHHNCLIRGHGRQRQHWHFRRGTGGTGSRCRGNLASVGGTPLLCAPGGMRHPAAVELDGAAEAWTTAPWCRCCQWQASPTRIATTDPRGVSRRPLPHPQTRAFIDFLVEAMAPARAALIAASASSMAGRKSRRRAEGPGVWT